MRPIVLALCVSAAACSGQAVDSPTSPPRTTAALAIPAQSGGELPLRGSFTMATTGVVNCPPTCPPTTVTISGTQEGTASHLGRFTAISIDVVALATATSTGTFTFTAANGDQLFTTTTGGEDEFIPPNISVVSMVATIVGGTGRFAGATGTLTIRHRGAINFATATSSGSGSFDGQISLNR